MTSLENRERFYFPDASQISVMIGHHSRQMKTQICTFGDVGVRRRRSAMDLTHYQSTKLLAPVPLSQIIGNMGQTSIRYIAKIWDGRQKVKSSIVWDFPDI